MPKLSLRVPPVVVVAIAAAAMWLVARLFPALQVAIPEIVATGFAAVAMLLVVAGVLAFVKARTTVNPHRPERSTAIVASGVYRFSRNPMYLGFALLLAAWGCRLGNPLAFLVLPAFVAYMNRFQIAPEEEALAARFGDAYLAYKRNVRRWL